MIAFGTYWKRKKTGVIYKVTDINDHDELRLVPVCVPPGKNARVTWKWVMHVLIDLDQVEKPEGTT